MNNPQNKKAIKICDKTADLLQSFPLMFIAVLVANSETRGWKNVNTFQ